MSSVTKKTPATSIVTFEQPLNERIRTFMRVEQLFARCTHYMEKENAWDSHFSLTTLLELISLASRGDLKRELMKEIKRQIANFQQLYNAPNVDKDKLDKLITNHNELITQLDTMQGHLLGHLKDNDFINSIKQRAVIPGGTCDFDLPAYHYWLTQAATQRTETLAEWINPFISIHKSVVRCLDLIRDSSETEECVAARGFYQRTLDPNQPNQLIRVLVEQKYQCFPEISAGKHRFSIRFLTQINPDQYPKQVNHDIEFKIACCTF